MLDVTSFSTTAADVQWRTFTDGLSNAAVDLGRIVDTPTTQTPMWFDRLNADQDVIVELLVNSAGSTYKWEAYGRIESDGYTAGIDAIMDESVMIQVDGPFYYGTTE